MLSSRNLRNQERLPPHPPEIAAQAAVDRTGRGAEFGGTLALLEKSTSLTRCTCKPRNHVGLGPEANINGFIDFSFWSTPCPCQDPLVTARLAACSRNAPEFAVLHGVFADPG